MKTFIRKAKNYFFDLLHFSKSRPSASTQAHDQPPRKPLNILSEERRAQINQYLHELSQHSDLVTSGKLQFLNFEDVRNYMGYKWQMVEPIITRITEDVIAKYIAPEDIAFRYKEDEFIIIFASNNAEESLLKCQLIAKEINCLLFEEQKTHKKLKDLGLEHKLMQINAKPLRDAKNPLGQINVAFKEQVSSGADIHIEGVTPIKIKAPKKEETRKKPNQERKKQEYTNVDYLFLPVEHTKNKSDPIYLIILDCFQNILAKSTDPLTNHLLSCNTLTKSQAAQYDVFLLQKALEILSENPNIRCAVPVNYRTLASNDFSQNYINPLHRADNSVKSRLKICVQDLPENVTRVTLQNIASPLKNKCRHLFASISMDTKHNYSDFVSAGFTGVCTSIKGSDHLPKNFLHIRQKFINSIEKYSLVAMVIVGERTNAVLKRDEFIGFDYIAGAPIGQAVKYLGAG